MSDYIVTQTCAYGGETDTHVLRTDKDPHPIALRRSLGFYMPIPVMEPPSVEELERLIAEAVVKGWTSITIKTGDDHPHPTSCHIVIRAELDRVDIPGAPIKYKRFGWGVSIDGNINRLYQSQTYNFRITPFVPDPAKLEHVKSLSQEELINRVLLLSSVTQMEGFDDEQPKPPQTNAT